MVGVRGDHRECEINQVAPRRGARSFDVKIFYVDLQSRLQIMGSTFFSLHYHMVFSTKERRPFIKLNGNHVFMLISAGSLKA